MFIGWVDIRRRFLFQEGEVDKPFSVGGDMGEPVVVVVTRDLLLSAAIGFHPPDLHQAAPDGIEVDILAVGRVFRAVIEAGSNSPPDLFAPFRGDLVHIELAIAFAAEDHVFSVRGPAMEVGRTPRCDLFGYPALDGNGVDDGAAEVFYEIA